MTAVSKTLAQAVLNSVRLGLSRRAVTERQLQQNADHFAVAFDAANELEQIESVRVIAQQYSATRQGGTKTSSGNDRLLNQQKAHAHSAPAYKEFISALVAQKNGIQTLLRLRELTLRLYRSADSEEHRHQLHFLAEELRFFLHVVFSPSAMHVHRITWSSTSCELMQRVAEADSVHPVRTWSEIKRRVGVNKRCFSLLHPSLPTQPVVVLHVALADHIVTQMSDILKTAQNTDSEQEKNTAIFYSINNALPGLAGIDLGNAMIKESLQLLRAELPNLTQFSTLSPVPRFRSWLLESLKRRSISLESILAPPSFDELKLNQDELIDVLSSDDIPQKLQNALIELCRHYLMSVKHRSLAFDPVANFHLRNGAVLYRINPFADRSLLRIRQSFGLMVNYRYYPEQLKQNSEEYLNTGIVKLDPAMEAQNKSRL